MGLKFVSKLSFSHEDGQLAEHFRKHHGGDIIYGFSKAQYLFKTYSVRYRELKSALDDYCTTFQHIMNIRKGQVKLEDMADFLKISSEQLKTHFFTNLILKEIDNQLEDDLLENPELTDPRADNVISIATFLEAYFKTRDQVSISQIEELDVEKIVGLTGNKKLVDEDEMFNFLQSKPYYLAVRK